MGLDQAPPPHGAVGDGRALQGQRVDHRLWVLGRQLPPRLTAIGPKQRPRGVLADGLQPLVVTEFVPRILVRQPELTLGVGCGYLRVWVCG